MHLRQPRVEGAEQVASFATSFGFAWSWRGNWLAPAGCHAFANENALAHGLDPGSGSPPKREERPFAPDASEGEHTNRFVRDLVRVRVRVIVEGSIRCCRLPRRRERERARERYRFWDWPSSVSGRAPFAPDASEGEWPEFLRSRSRSGSGPRGRGRVGWLLPVATPSRTRTRTRTVSILGLALLRSGKGGHSPLTQARANRRIGSFAISFGFGFA